MLPYAIPYSFNLYLYPEFLNMENDKQIQLFKPSFNKKRILQEIEECLDRSWTGIGYKTVTFEERFKAFTKLPYAHFLNSATSGLHLALEILKRRALKPHSQFVVTSPLTFISDTAVIYHARLGPQFVDIDDTLCMNPLNLRIHLASHKYTTLPLAVIYTGIGGNTGQLFEIVKVCREYNVPLILDASHMMGTYYNDNHIGNEGQDFTVFSFQATKNLPTADSGMLCCKNAADDALARKLSWLGINKDTYNRQVSGGNWDYNIEDIGYKYHGNSIMAAMGIVGLEELPYKNSARRFIANVYDINLSSFFERIFIPSNCTSSRYLYQVRVPSEHRDELINYARECGIQLGVHYKVHTAYGLWAYRCYIDNVPEAIQASSELISLPIGSHLLAEVNQYRVINVLNEYARRYS